MKPASEWDLDYILQIPPGEYDWVEFKGRPKLDASVPGVKKDEVCNELAKQLSAFANSGGGVLVYGISNPTNRGPLTVDDGGISMSCQRPNIREWLEDMIPNLVEFPLKRFNVYCLTSQKGAPGLAADRCIVLVEIPDSEDVPHQSTADKKYYARVAGKSRPIGHRLVSDMFHRERHARFELDFFFQSKTYVPNLYPKWPERDVRLAVMAINRGKVYAKYISLILWVPYIITPKDQRLSRVPSEDELGKYYIDQLTNQRGEVFKPVLPGLYTDWELECHSRLRPSDFKSEAIRWVLYFDNAPKQSGTIALRDVKFDQLDEHPFEQLRPESPVQF